MDRLLRVVGLSLAFGFVALTSLAQQPPKTTGGENRRDAVLPPVGTNPGARANIAPNFELLPPPAEDGRPLDLRSSSWTYVPPTVVKAFKEHDIISIRIDEIARVRAEGASESRKNGAYDSILKDWLRLDGFSVKPAPQSGGDLRARSSMNSLYRADASVESRESLSTNIAAEIVDIRPNGSLVVEAHKRIQVNDNFWDTSLAGICRAQDIGPDNVVLSRDILDLKITKQERGRLQDGYRRGWFTRWFETLQPF